MAGVNEENGDFDNYGDSSIVGSIDGDSSIVSSLVVWVQGFAENLQIKKAKSDTVQAKNLKDQRKTQGRIVWKLQELCKPL